MDGWNAIMGNTVLKEAYPTQLAEYSKLYKFDEKRHFYQEIGIISYHQ